MRSASPCQIRSATTYGFFQCDNTWRTICFPTFFWLVVNLHDNTVTRSVVKLEVYLRGIKMESIRRHIKPRIRSGPANFRDEFGSVVACTLTKVPCDYEFGIAV